MFRYELGAPNNAQCDEKVVNHWQDVPESIFVIGSGKLEQTVLRCRAKGCLT